MKLSYSEIALLRHIFTTTGDTEIQANGQEGLSPRRLNGEESSQRRHYTKATKESAELIETKVKEIQETHNALVESTREQYKKDNKKEVVEGAKELTAEEKKAEKEAEKLKEDLYVSKYQDIKDSLKKAVADVEELYTEKHDVELAAKTLMFLKKYFKLWGENPGWIMWDDETVESLYEILK